SLHTPSLSLPLLAKILKSEDPPFAPLPLLSACTAIQHLTTKPPVATSQSFTTAEATVYWEKEKDCCRYIPSPTSIPAVLGHKLRLIGFILSREIRKYTFHNSILSGLKITM
ncbi:hypothetical protein PanWU01x14_037740, partial [Parasponia andersonii]